MRFPISIGPWGPRPLLAFAPVLAAFAFAGWIWFADRGPLAPPPVTITALKPVAGSAAGSQRAGSANWRSTMAPSS